MAVRVVLFLLISSLCASCGEMNKGKDSVRGAGDGDTTLVVVAPIRTGRVESVIERTGDVETLYQVPLYPEASGRVLEVMVDVGDRVEIGAELVLLNDEAARLAERSATAALTDAKETEAQREIELEEAGDQKRASTLRSEQALREHKRTADLFEQRLVTQRELEEKKLDLQNAEANLRAADFAARKAQVALHRAASAVDSANIESEKAALTVRQHTLKAPFAGVISERHTNPGSVVGTSITLLTLVDHRHLVIPLKINQKDLTRVAVGQEVEIRAREAFPGRVFKGRVERLSPVVDVVSGSRVARVVILDGIDELRPGIFVQCRVQTRVEANTLLLPRRAVFYQDQKPSFFAVIEGLARLVIFVPGPGTDDALQILEHIGPELEEGMSVVTIGKDRLEEGDPVRTGPATKASEPATDSADPAQD